MRELCLVFTGVAAATWILRHLERYSVLVRDNLHLMVGALFLMTAIRCSERLPGGLPHYGLSLGGLLSPTDEAPHHGPVAWLVDLIRALIAAVPSFLRELAVALGVCALIFPPFVFVFRFWHAPTHDFAFLPQRDIGSYVVTQLVVVGLPEEALFRGYFQGRLHDVFPKRVRLLGASLSPAALILQAVLFALLHFIVDMDPMRLAVFFPALLFGWIAARRGGIGAGIFVHAFSNLLSDLLVRGWL